MATMSQSLFNQVFFVSLSIILKGLRIYLSQSLFNQVFFVSAPPENILQKLGLAAPLVQILMISVINLLNKYFHSIRHPVTTTHYNHFLL